MGEAKAFFHTWCSKQKIESEIDIKNTGPKHRQRFLCEIRVPGYDYVAVGNSTNKKDAQKNASMDFLQYLLRIKKITTAEIAHIQSEMGTSVNETDGGGPSDEPSQGGSAISSMMQNRGPSMPSGSSNVRNYSHGGEFQNLMQNAFHQRMADRQGLEEAEALDVNSAIHGNWTLENAKSRLNQFMQQHKIHADYKYIQIGPDHSR